MSFTKKVRTLLAEIVTTPSKPSYVIEHNGVQVVMRPGGNYANTNLAGFSFKGLDLRKTNFQGANLKGVDFSGAHLEGANFTDSDLHGALLSGAHLESATIEPSSLAVANLESIPSGIPDDFVTELKSGKII